MGPSLKDVSSDWEGGVIKKGILGRLSRLNWGDRGREGSKKLRKMRRRLLWMIPYKPFKVWLINW